MVVLAAAGIQQLHAFARLSFSDSRTWESRVQIAAYRVPTLVGLSSAEIPD
jgi:hypothetical protein